MKRQRPPSVARLASAVQQLRRRVRRLEGHRRRIGFRRAREDIDTEAISGDFVFEQDEDRDWQEADT